MASAFHRSSLCFLPAADVKSPVGYMGGLELRGEHNERMGPLAGVLIDREHGRLQYLVVHSPNRYGRCCLVATDELVCLDTSYRTLRVESPVSGERPEFDLDWVRFFSDTESLAALAS